jgi:diaminopimelate decarboxylase
MNAFSSFTTSLKEKSQFIHSFAMKSCPISYIIHRAIQSGLGIEVASFAELYHALNSGCHPTRIMFDR